MCNPVAAAWVIAAATVYQGYQSYQQGKFNKGVADYNARQLDNEATRTRNVGVEQENRQRLRTAQLMETQKVQSAASGVDVNSGSALQLREDSALQGEVDALTIKENFSTRAQSLNDQAGLVRMQGENAKKAGKNEFVMSIGKAAATVFGGYAAAGSGAAAGSTGVTAGSTGASGLSAGETLSSSWYSNNSSLYSLR